MKKCKLINLTIFLAIFIINIIYTINFIQKGTTDRIGNNVILIIILLLPLIIEKTTKRKISCYIKTITYIFIFLSQLLGCVIDLYRSINWYDNLIHFISGTLTVLAAIIFINKIFKNNQIDKKFLIIYLLGSIFLVSAIWEIFEYITDVILKTDLQYQKESGVVDTMQDMIAAFFGGVLVIIPYLIETNKGVLHKLIRKIKIFQN